MRKTSARRLIPFITTIVVVSGFLAILLMSRSSAQPGLSDSSTVEETKMSLGPPIKISAEAGFSRPVWSPTARDTLAFIGPDGTYIYSLSSKTVKQISKSVTAFPFVWAADGQSIVYRVAVEDGTMAIRRLDVPTGVEKTVVESSYLSLPRTTSGGGVITNDGTKTVTNAASEGPKVADDEPYAFPSEDQIYVVHDGSTKKVTSAPGRYFFPVISPDRSKVLYQELGPGFYVYDLNTTKTQFICAGDDPTWSPLSRYILFERVSDDGHRILTSDLFACDLAGRTTQLTFTSGLVEMHPAMSSDASTIAFESGGAIWISPVKFSNGVTK